MASMMAAQMGSGVVCPRRVRQAGRAALSAPVHVRSSVRVKASSNESDLALRHQQVSQHFPTALGVDDFIARVETTLSGYGFTGDNSIAMTNLCRDEVTAVLKDKIESAFGSSFNTNGLGGVLTCGATGMGAGLSHSPICPDGKERYVFFSFPHIAIDATGEVGSIARPGRAGRSCACGALAKCLSEFKNEGYANNCKVPGVHDPLDPEYSILKQRLARRLRHEQTDLSALTLPSITAVAERTITNDLEYLIEKAVDTSKADYAVVTGVQVHNWATDLEHGAASMEMVAPTKMFVVINGQRINLDLAKVPPLSPRQLKLLGHSKFKNVDAARSSAGVLQGLPREYLLQKVGGASILTPKRATPTNSTKKASNFSAAAQTNAPASTPSLESIDGDYQKKDQKKDQADLSTSDIAFLEKALAAQAAVPETAEGDKAVVLVGTTKEVQQPGLGGWLNSIWK